jgi:hypothetical protein
MAQEPMAMHHLGSGIWSQSFFTRDAIFTVMVPATTITSACRGVARTMVPIRSMSTRLAAVAMNSMPQQLVAMGNTQSALLIPQVST